MMQELKKFSWCVLYIWPTTIISFFRDPNFVETSQSFENCIDWAINGNFSDQDVDKAKLGVFSQVCVWLWQGFKRKCKISMKLFYTQCICLIFKHCESWNCFPSRIFLVRHIISYNRDHIRNYFHLIGPGTLIFSC